MVIGPVDPPRTLFLELTSYCNMHCAFCPSDVLRRPKEHLSEARLRKFLDQIHALNLRTPVLLNVLGEPLLNKKVYEVLDLLDAEGHPVTLITNVSLLGDPDVRRQLLRHGNLTMALSLQTATKRSYRMRGYNRLPFKKFYGMVFDVIEDKFQAGSAVRLEVHVASNFVVSHDPTVQAERGLNLWANFPSDGAERRWIARTLKRLERLAAVLEKRYPEAYARERAAALDKYREHIGTKIALDRAGLPPDFHRLKDEIFWGYMVLPNVFLVFKSLELWTRDRDFLRAALPAGAFVYVEEREEPRSCIMADNFGLLANGEYVLCCLDYEAEMAIGNIDSMPVGEALGSEKRTVVRKNAMTEKVCRRCKGNVFIFDTAPLSSHTQEIDRFGRGWWELEPGLYSSGGRWTKGRAWAYVYGRIAARSLRLSFLSPAEETVPLELTVSVYDPHTDDFAPVASFPFRGRKDIPSEFEAAFDFAPGRLYRIQIDSPAFVPDEVSHNGDTRRLGIAVFSMTLRA
jgi:hypothetical protein